MSMKLDADERAPLVSLPLNQTTSHSKLYEAG